MLLCLDLNIYGQVWLLSLLSNFVQKCDMDSIWNKRSKVIKISWDHLHSNRL